MDTCQRCHQRAYVQVWNPRLGRRLTFCGHHYREHEKALHEQHWVVEVDDRAELLTPA